MQESFKCGCRNDFYLTPESHIGFIVAKRGLRNPSYVHSGLRINNGRAKVRLISGWMPRAWAVWIQRFGPPPNPGFGCNSDFFVVHHQNEDPLDDRIENLELKTLN